MQTHNTADCCKWNDDDTSKFNKSNKDGHYKNNNAHAMDGDMKACFAQMRKDLGTRRRNSSPRRARRKVKSILTLLTLAIAVTPNRMMGHAIVVLLMK